jgi:hypothetical protein
MVIAGIKKRKTQGARKKNGFISAKPAFRILNSSLKIQRNNPLINKKTPITKYAIGLVKNELNSFLKIGIKICVTVYVLFSFKVSKFQSFKVNKF